MTTTSSIITTSDVANKLVELCRRGEFGEAVSTLYHEDVVSVEPEGAPNPTVSGLDAVKEKEKQFNASVKEVHGMEISDPVVAGNHFSCAMMMDVTMHEYGRQKMEEICVYEVKDGKIVREEFFYTMGG